MITDGLEPSGELEFARERKLRYCRMAASSGRRKLQCAVRSRVARWSLHLVGHTWSASVFLILAHPLLP